MVITYGYFLNLYMVDMLERDVYAGQSLSGHWLVVYLALWKMMEFVNGKDDIPYIMETIIFLVIAMVIYIWLIWIYGYTVYDNIYDITMVLKYVINHIWVNHDKSCPLLKKEMKT